MCHGILRYGKIYEYSLFVCLSRYGAHTLAPGPTTTDRRHTRPRNRTAYEKNGELAPAPVTPKPRCHTTHTQKNLHFFWCVQSTYNFLWLFVVSYHLTKRAGPREHSLLTGRPRCSFLRHEVPSSVIGQTIIYFFARYHGNTTPGTKFTMKHNDTISHVK